MSTTAAPSLHTPHAGVVADTHGGGVRTLR